ncbi:MAG TPA: hypothetical protein VG675_07645 [Bryobacteraceae bacterium]|nr:hypothetical protein [Bryobacteraceae bacterium]
MAPARRPQVEAQTNAKEPIASPMNTLPKSARADLFAPAPEASQEFASPSPAVAEAPEINSFESPRESFEPQREATPPPAPRTRQTAETRLIDDKEGWTVPDRTAPAPVDVRPKVEIGSIEIEIVPPPAAVSPAKPPVPARRTSAAIHRTAPAPLARDFSSTAGLRQG